MKFLKIVKQSKSIECGVITNSYQKHRLPPPNPPKTDKRLQPLKYKVNFNIIKTKKRQLHKQLLYKSKIKIKILEQSKYTS
jgi:hypothetical protein